MKKVLFITFGALFFLSGVAAVWRPEKASSGKVPLLWVSDNNPARTEQIAAFNEENPGLQLRLDYGTKGPQKIILQCASGVGPDIFDYKDEEMGTYVEAGVLMDVTEAANRMGFSAGKNGWPASVNTYCLNRRQYGFPCNTGASILIYNKNVFDHFGVRYPAPRLTWEEFIELAKTVSTAGKPGGKDQIYAVTGVGWRTFFDSLRGEFFTEDGRLQIANSAALRKSFEMHRDFLFKYKLMPTAVEAKALSGQGGWGSGNLNQFASGRFAMIVTGHWSLIGISRARQQQAKALEDKGMRAEELEDPLRRPLRIGGTVFPHFAGTAPAYRVLSRVAGINARSPRREQALKFLQYLAGREYAKLLNENADWLPGNPAYVEVGVDQGTDDLPRGELQAATEEAVANGYSPRRSPFLLITDVTRVLGEQISRLESNPSIPVESLLETADRELRVLMRRNLSRNPELRDLFVSRFGEQAVKQL